MEEITLVLSSLAGACTAVALNKIPKIKHNKQTPTVSLVLENQLQSLGTEREILTKTITRLHQQDSGLSGVQKDKLLIRYQHQLGTVISKIEKLENASKYPDLGPIGDSLISLMDTKLSHLDQRLHEISSKIILSTTVQTKQPEAIRETLQEKLQIRKNEPDTEIPKHESEVRKEITDTQKDKPQILLSSIEVPTAERHRSVELSTLTEITNKIPEFPADLIKPSSVEANQILEDAIRAKTTIEESTIAIPKPIPQSIKGEIPTLEIKSEPTQQLVIKKTQLPAPIKISEDEKLDDDDKDLDKIKSEIMKALSKLEQVEVE